MRLTTTSHYLNADNYLCVFLISVLLFLLLDVMSYIWILKALAS